MGERALYLGQAHDAPDPADPYAFATADRVDALEKLLVLCSHFQATGGAAASAGEECRRITDQKERRVVKLKNRLLRCCWVLRLLQHKVAPAGSAGVWSLLGFAPSPPEHCPPWQAELKRRCEEQRAASEEHAPAAVAAKELERAL